MDATLAVLVPFSEVVGLDNAKVLKRLRVRIDDYVIHDFQGRQVHRAELLRHEGPMICLFDVGVASEARHQNRRLALGVNQMANMSGMYQVERAVTHNDLALARRRTEQVAQFRRSLDLTLKKGLFCRCHFTASGARLSRKANQVLVASAIDAESQTGASRQYAMCSSIF